MEILTHCAQTIEIPLHPLIYNPFTRTVYLQWLNSPATLQHSSILYDSWLNSNPVQVKCESWGPACFASPGELTRHDCSTLWRKQPQPLQSAHCLELGSGRHMPVSSEERVPLTGTTCLMATRKYVSHCSFTDKSRTRELPHTAVEGSQMNTGARLSRGDRPTLWGCSSNTSMDDDNMTGKQNYNLSRLK